MQRTAEQSAIIDLGTGTNESFIVDAKAGSGKTTTLLELMNELPGTTIYLAFNRAIADEVKLKASRKLSFEKSLDVSISTVHSHGLAAFRRAGARPKTLSDKLMFMLKDQVESQYDRGDDIFRNLGKIKNLASFAKSAGFGLNSIHEAFPAITDEQAWFDMVEHYGIEEDLVGEFSVEELISQARLLLAMSNKRTNSIDFDDMIYLPLLMNMQLNQYDNVLIDEAQDINATRRELAFRSIKPGGRLIAVGDPNQAIYGFTGADTQSLNLIHRRLSRGGTEARIMPLSICWRCDSRIIESAQREVPTIQARPNAPEGQVLTVDFQKDDFLDLAQPGDAVLCRLNKPNVAVCLGFLRRGKSARIEGRDLGKRLEFHVMRASDRYAFQKLDETLSDLEAYAETEIGKMAAKNKSEATIALFEDEVDATRLIIERCIEDRKLAFSDFTNLVNQLFGDNVSSKSTITLCSIHKAKGREWPRVWLLGYRDYMPFHLAKQDWEVEQEHNLIYVAKTRAEHMLAFVNGVQSALDRGIHREGKRPDHPQAMRAERTHRTAPTGGGGTSPYTGVSYGPPNRS